MNAYVVILLPMLVGGLRQFEDGNGEGTFLNLIDENEQIGAVTKRYGTPLYIAGPEGAIVQDQREQYPDSDIMYVIEVRTKLRFVGNAVELKDPDRVALLASDIHDQMQNYPDSKYMFCLHIGTSATEDMIQRKKPEFMQNRLNSVQSGLEDVGGDIGLGGYSEISDNHFEHFQSTRFADLVMKVFKGENKPGCAKSDLAPPNH
jgi:hypothetical protein